jgi:N-acetylglucosaminyldiphosphoundecaprenol N-acetyl-beta-D-mannosaminyltransferase
MDALSILGVRIANCSQRQAIELIERLMSDEPACARAIFIANAHTLNLAWENAEYRHILNNAHRVFADGTGTRWAARLRGVSFEDNLVGTDLVPELFRATAGRGYRCFLLGSDERTIAQAAAFCARTYPGWDFAGFHHGYSRDCEVAQLVERINTERPHLLLVAMGNPLQERWIHRHRDRLRVPVCIGVGGLFDHWAGNLRRAPLWVRNHGFEWLQILFQQPHKWRRYLIGNPKFLYRIVRELPKERMRNRVRGL